MSDRTTAGLIGRLGELAILERTMSRVRSGTSAVVLIGGDAGVGKTRLVGELVGWARTEGAPVLVGRCVELAEGTLPLAPLIEALRVLPTVLPEEHAALFSAAGQDAPGVVELDEGDLAQDSRRLFGRVLDVLHRIAEREVLVVVVEDLHWADQATRDLLACLVANLSGERLLLVGTFRHDEVHNTHPLRRWLAELERNPRTVRVELAPFTREETAAQLASLLGTPPEADLVATVFRRAEGNAFFNEELMAARGVGAHLSDTIRDVVLARVDGVNDKHRKLVRVASAGGGHLDHDLLRAVAGADEPAFTSAVRELVAHRILVVDGDGYRFRHALTREAVESDLLPRERVGLHARFAHALAATDRRDAVTLAELSHHWYAAKQTDNALAAALDAGRAAAAIPAPTEALAQFERVLELWESATPGLVAAADRIDVLMEAGDAAYLAGRLSRATALFEAALASSSSVEAARIGDLHDRLTWPLWFQDRGEEARRHLDRALQLVPPLPPSEARARVLASHARMLALDATVPVAAAERAADDALDAARRASSPQWEASALNSRGLAHMKQGSLVDAMVDLEQGLRVARQAGADGEIARSMLNLTHALVNSARHPEGLALARTTYEFASQSALGAGFAATAEANLIRLLYDMGDWDEATERASRFGTAFPADSPRAGLTQALVLVARGRFREARARLFPPSAHGPMVTDFVGAYLPAAATLALWEGRPDDARGLLSDLPVERLDSRDYPELAWLATWAEADAVDRDADPRSIAVHEGIALAWQERLTRLIDVGTPTGCRPGLDAAFYLELLDGEISRLRGRSDPAVWRAAADHFANLGHIYHSAYARFRCAEAFITTTKDRSAATEPLRKAYENAHRLGAQPLLHLIERMGARAQISLTTDTVDAEDAPFGLTDRERQVLALVAAGRTNRQIADELYISVKTASAHVSNILTKLQVTTRGEAAATAHQLRLTG